MVFGLALACYAVVTRKRSKAAAFSTVVLLLLALPCCAEEPGSGTRGTSSLTPSAHLHDPVVTANNLSAGNTSPVLLPAMPEPVQPVLPIAHGPKPQTEIRNSEVIAWRALIVAQHSAAVFDAFSTRRALTSGNGYERDPLMKPFANSAVIYPATQAAPLLFDFLGYRMMRSQNRYLRRAWWLPQAASFAGSVWCGSRNLHVANLKR